MPKALLSKPVRPLIRRPVSRMSPLSTLEGVGASAFASSAAPDGYHWDFVTSNGEQVTSGGIPVVDLVRN